MRFLITNDDGIFSEGLECLRQVAERFGEAFVVAPDSEKSGISHAITLTKPLRVYRLSEKRYSLTGTPTDCIFVGINHILDQRPDMVLAGINRGPNLGYDVIYSGTVGGAMEGTIQGVPSIAFSLVSLNEYRFEEVVWVVEDIIRKAITYGFPEGVMLNVNIPQSSISPIKGFRVTRLGNRFYSNEIVTRVDPRGGEYLWIGGTRITMDRNPLSDCGAVYDGFVSITPIKPDMMAHDVLEKIRFFEKGG